MIRRLAGAWLALLSLLALILPGPADAHALDPGYLELHPLGGEEWRVTWRKPQVQGRAMAIDALLPETCEARRAPSPVFDGRGYSAVWITRCAGGVTGGKIAIGGLEHTRTDVLVRFQSGPDAPVQTRRLTPVETRFQVPAPQGALGVMASFFRLGFDHILEGFDHLLFVFALLLLVRGQRRIVAAVTAFTVAHSLTLGAVTLGLFSVPPPPVEAVVALSIVILAAELAQPAGQGLRLTELYPWAVAFAFGLLHGLGFASALREIGLPESDVPLALLFFNLGVEAGQLAFIFAVLAAGLAALRVLRLEHRTLSAGSPTVTITAYAIGTVAAYWMIERVVGFVT